MNTNVKETFRNSSLIHRTIVLTVVFLFAGALTCFANTVNQATQLPGDDQWSSQITLGDDEELWYRIDVAGFEVLNIDTIVYSKGFAFYIYNYELTEKFYERSTGLDGQTFGDELCLAKGTYYLKIKAGSSFKIKTKRTKYTTDEKANNSQTTPHVYDFSGKVTGTITRTGDEYWYRINARVAGIYSFDFSCWTNIKFMFYLYNSDLSKEVFHTGLAQKGYWQPSSGKINQELTKGTYYLKITHYTGFYANTNGGRYDVNITAPKASQSISASDVTKTYGASPFQLKASLKKGDGTLSYKSSNVSVAKISSSGKVTIKGAGQTTIIIKASETSTYNAVTKKIKLIVRPSRPKISKITNTQSGKIQLRWTKSGGAKGYELQFASDRNFSKIVKTVKISNPKTVKKTVQCTAGKYYIRIRGYAGKAKSNWSKIKTIKVKITA